MNVKKLTIEITGKPITPCVKILADGKVIGKLNSMNITANEDDLHVDVELIQSTVIEKDGKKELIREPLVLKWGK